MPTRGGAWAPMPGALAASGARDDMKVLLVDDHPLILVGAAGGDPAASATTSPWSASTARRRARGALRDDARLRPRAARPGAGRRRRLRRAGRVPRTPTRRCRWWWSRPPTAPATSSARIDLGAMGFVPKRSSNERAVRGAAHGDVRRPCTCRRSMLGLDFARGSRERAADTVPDVMRVRAAADSAAGRSGAPRAAPGAADRSTRIGLTPRQAEVLALLLQGLPNKLIARQLNLSVETVKDHVAAVLRALGVSSRTQAVLAVSQMTQRQGGFGARRRRARCSRRRAGRRRAPPAPDRRPPADATGAPSAACARRRSGVDHVRRCPCRRRSRWSAIVLASLFGGAVRAAGLRGAWCLAAVVAGAAVGAAAAALPALPARARAPTTPDCCAWRAQLARAGAAAGRAVGRRGVAVLGPGHALPPASR
ncbi:MAG: response regulator transcription factor [Comamonadaceae bacterium]|nr:response regulator transcription factor [Comamonadaceae bacterium]